MGGRGGLWMIVRRKLKVLGLAQRSRVHIVAPHCGLEEEHYLHCGGGVWGIRFAVSRLVVEFVGKHLK